MSLPRWLADITERVRVLLFRSCEEAGMEEELRFHIEMETERLVRERGLPAAESRRRALIAFGGVERTREEVREARGTRLLEDGWRDLRLGARRLAREPSFSIPAAATLALGTGVAAAIFALVHTVLLRPLPYPDADRLVTIGHAAPGFGLEAGGISDGLFAHYRAHSRVVAEIGVYHENEQNLTDGIAPARVPLAMASPGVFRALGAAPHLGRLFTDDDARSGDVPILISHDLWRSRYGGDPAIVGGTIETNGSPSRVIGVLPPGFDFPRPETGIWYPSAPDAERAGVRDLYRRAVARLRPGVTPAEAERDLRRLVGTLADAYPDVTPDQVEASRLRAVVTPLRESVVGGARPALVLLLAAAGLVLVIAWANAANLVLLRAERQRGEVLLARALGARGPDLARRFLGESMMLAAVAGAAAIVVAWAGVATRFGFELGQIPRLHELRVDGTVIALVTGLSCAAGVLLGLVPLVRTRRAGPHEPVMGSAGRATDGRGVRRAQRALLTVQVALALALLVGAATMTRSVANLLRVDPGFDAASTLTLGLPLAYRQYPRYADAVGLQMALLERVRAVPGVLAAEATLHLPLTPDAFLEVPVAAAADADDEAIPPTATANFATPGYFALMGIPVLRGRAFEPDDLAGDAPPVAVSRALARSLFGDADALGRGVRLAERSGYPEYTIVGVVGDVAGETLTGGPARTLYFPMVPDPHAAERRNPPVPFIPREGSTVVIRTSVPPLSAAAAVRRVVRSLDPGLPLSGVRTLDEVVAAATARARLTTLLLLLGAGAALALGVVGIYGAMAYWVGRRRPELGVRLALGARPADLGRLVRREGLRLVLPGIAAGLVVALAMTRLLRGLLFEVAPTDPAAFAGTAALLLLVALVAIHVPVRRARRIDAASTLRTE